MSPSNGLKHLLASLLIGALLLVGCNLGSIENPPQDPILSEPSASAQPVSEDPDEVGNPEQAAQPAIPVEAAEDSADELLPAEVEDLPGEESAPIDQPGLPMGPESYPEGINPLTGLPVADPAVLQDCPLLVAISNFPPSTRQSQSGLSLAAQVWETFIGEGMTRYLAVFYGDYAHEIQSILENPLAETGDFAIGPIRSGRVAFEDIKVLFPGATLVTAGASAEVAAQLTGVQTAYSSDPEDISSAGLAVSQLGGLPCRHGKPPSLSGLAFDPTPPHGGEEAGFFRVIYNYFNQVGWEYDAEAGAYLRSQDKSDGTGELHPTLESLTGEQLAFENVLVLFADHHFLKPTIVEISLMYVDNHQGLLFRDGRVYRIKWSTLRGELRLTDSEGNTIPLRPGQTFLEVVSYQTTWNPQQLTVRYHNP